ncbi:FAD-dependent oxidoreductase [Actinoplanes rectilineatus]|uniref:FAD-dependent oxidoreductase n=1 Tax=Actinoplanes rectilineatus TaxID=113571 RepID=UPI0005F29FBD|nr:hypothetical protein [Actinoplanes rectilineatus]
MRHAVVIGASIGGMLAARALTSTFDQVTLIDRDTVPDRAVPRRSVPQSRQAHVLLARGSTALEELFPGFVDEMLAAGVPAGDAHADCHWYLDGHPMRRAPSTLPVFGVSRPLLEHLVRQRLRALPGVRILDGEDVTALLHDKRVRGVRTTRSEMLADLVVDASGRATRAPRWLRSLGYGEIPVTTVRSEVVYTTRHYRYDPGAGAPFAVVMAPYPGMQRTGVTIRQDGDRVVVLLAGMLGEEPPTDDAGMLAFAESLPGPEIAAFLRTAEPLDAPARMRYPASVRHHYERLRRRPVGFLALGDALCSFNPIYGQGVTVAALEALLLAALIGTAPERYFREAARLVDNPWALASATDLRFPQVEGRRRPTDRPLNAYLARYRAATVHDATLGAAFLRVSNMLAPPAHLLAPSTILRVLRADSTINIDDQELLGVRHTTVP